jgi:hypothetical protein
MPYHSATNPQERASREYEDLAQVLASQWLGGRDSNPDTQLQSLSEPPAPQQDQALSPAKHGQLRQNPQYSRNKNFEVDAAEDTLP